MVLSLSTAALTLVFPTWPHWLPSKLQTACGTRCAGKIELLYMHTLQSLINDLESPYSSIRDRAALELMDLRDESAVEPLLRAIAKPENINHRGTLVYALSAFDCEPFIEALVDLVLTGNFEVSCGALGILEESARSGGAIRRIQAQARKFEVGSLVSDHNVDGLEMLLGLAEE